jgi:hypothetical protein
LCKVLPLRLGVCSSRLCSGCAGLLGRLWEVVLLLLVLLLLLLCVKGSRLLLPLSWQLLRCNDSSNGLGVIGSCLPWAMPLLLLQR